MRVAILSDVHANLEALTRALDLIDELRPDSVVCLGDLVGYGPDPGPCVDLIRERCDAVVLGNHDEAVAFDRGVNVLPREGRKAALLHQKLLTEEQLTWLRGLPLVLVGRGMTLAHAAPLAPESWPRLNTFHELQAQFSAFETEVCFVGHSHRPAIVADKVGVHRLRHGHRYLIDVGSVGQPRDHDPRLCFGVFDSEAFTFEHVRAHYDLERTVIKIREAKLPRSLASRLRQGV